MNKVLAVTVGMSRLFVGPAYAECSADDLITPIVPVATGYDTNGALGGSWTVIDTFKQNQDTVCINQSQTENFAPHGMLWVEYKSGLGTAKPLSWKRSGSECLHRRRRTAYLTTPLQTKSLSRRN
jgi:hypothetical protein